MNNTQSKFLFTLDVKKAEQQKLRELRQQKEEQRQHKLLENTSREAFKVQLLKQKHD